MITETPTKPLMAACIMVCAMMIIGAIDNFVIRVAEGVGLWQFHLTRAVLALPLVAGLSLLGLGSIWPVRWWAVGLRSVLVAISMLFYFSALALMPIAQALAGLFTSPIFILLISAVALRRPIGRWRILAVLVGFTGTLCVLQPDPQNFDFKTLIPVAGGFFYALSAIATRSLCAGESTVAMLGGVMSVLGIMGGAGLVGLYLWPLEQMPGPDGFATRGWTWPITQVLPLVALQAVGSVAGVFLVIRAYQLADPSHVSVFEYSVMIFGPLFAWFAFGQVVGPVQMLGIALIAAAGAVIAVRSRQAEVAA